MKYSKSDGFVRHWVLITCCCSALVVQGQNAADKAPKPSTTIKFDYLSRLAAAIPADAQQAIMRAVISERIKQNPNGYEGSEAFIKGSAAFIDSVRPASSDPASPSPEFKAEVVRNLESTGPQFSALMDKARLTNPVLREYSNEQIQAVATSLASATMSGSGLDSRVWKFTYLYPLCKPVDDKQFFAAIDEEFSELEKLSQDIPPSEKKLVMQEVLNERIEHNLNGYEASLEFKRGSKRFVKWAKAAPSPEEQADLATSFKAEVLSNLEATQPQFTSLMLASKSDNPVLKHYSNEEIQAVALSFGMATYTEDPKSWSKVKKVTYLYPICRPQPDRVTTR